MSEAAASGNPPRPSDAPVPSLWGELDDRLTMCGLSAPELCVLRRGGRSNGRDALRTAVLELIVRGVLRLDSHGSSRRYVSVKATGVEVELDPPVAAVARVSALLR